MTPNGGNLQQAKRRAFGSRVSCSWSWEPAMLVGGILSATDPVAVVALLKELGVKKSLATLIEAESLLNDGTAVVVYSILLKAVQAGGLAA